MKKLFTLYFYRYISRLAVLQNLHQYPVIASISEAIQCPYEMLEKATGSTMSQRFF